MVIGPNFGASDGITLTPTPQFAEDPIPHPPASAGVESAVKPRPITAAKTEILIRIFCVSHVIRPMGQKIYLYDAKTTRSLEIVSYPAAFPIAITRWFRTIGSGFLRRTIDRLSVSLTAGSCFV